MRESNVPPADRLADVQDQIWTLEGGKLRSATTCWRMTVIGSATCSLPKSEPGCSGGWIPKAPGKRGGAAVVERFTTRSAVTTVRVNPRE